MVTKTRVIPQEDLWPLLKSIKNQKLRVYASLLYWLACRSGELLPYQHYKVVYERDEQGKLRKDFDDNYIIKSKTLTYSRKSIPVSQIKLYEDKIVFEEIPIFKSKIKYNSKVGIVPRKNNPLFDDIYSFIEYRKNLQVTENIKAENSGSPPTTIYLFEKEEQDIDDLHFFWRFKKRLDRIMSKKGFSPHCLRKTRLTFAGNISGDPYYVKSLSGHASIDMASEYVAPKNLFENMKKYEGI